MSETDTHATLADRPSASRPTRPKLSSSLVGSLPSSRQLYQKMRSMAILCILLGPLLALTAISSFLVKRVMDWADRHGVPSPMGELSAVLIDFSVKTAWVLVPLGALITVAGIRGTREPRQAVRLGCLLRRLRPPYFACGAARRQGKPELNRFFTGGERVRLPGQVR